MKRLYLTIILALGSQSTAYSADDEVSPPLDAPLEVKSDIVGLLHTYCAGCHAIGKLNFLPSDSYVKNWHGLFNETSPISKTLWSTSILKVLDWPKDTPPAFGQLLDPVAGRDWMPKGIHRLRIAEDWFQPSDPSVLVPVNPRQYIREQLSKYQ